MTIAVGSSTPVGTYSIVVTGSGGGVKQSVAVTLIVLPGFALSVSPSSETIARGKSGTYTVTVTGNQGFSGTVALNVSGLAPKTTGTFNPTSVTNSGSSRLTVNVRPQAPRGTHSLTIRGTSGSQVQSTTANLTIR